MRRAVRAIIINNDQLLVMHRNKFGTEYDTLPGGNVEIGETPEQALKREIQEETMVEFTEPRLVFIEHAGDPFGDQYVFLCKYESGEPELAPDAEERAINELGKNLYQPAWAPMSKLAQSTFLSTKLRDQIIKYTQQGWPETAVEITTS